MKSFRKPYRVKRKRLIFKNRLFWLAILTLVIFSGVFYLVCFHSFFQVKAIEVSGNEKVSSENLENLLDERVNRKVLFFPSRSIFLANFDEIAKEILKNFPQVAETELRRKLPNTLLLQIEEREPVAFFCQTDKIFFIDKEGIVFESLNSSLANQGFTKLRSETDREINLGDNIVEKEQLGKVLEVESKLKKQLETLLVSDESSLDVQIIEEILVVSDVRFDVKTSEGFKIFFNFKEDLDWQLTKLKAVLEEQIPPERRRDLEYIDVRFDKFAPYIYRD